MIKNYVYSIIFLLIVSVVSYGRTEVNIDQGWRFIQKDVFEAQKPDYDDLSWRKLNVPHDWSVENEYSPNNKPQNSWLPVGIGWYRKGLNIPTSWVNKKVLLHFDGVYMNSQVWLNGKKVGGRPYGFMSFYCDLTGVLKAGNNMLAVRVDNTPAPTSRYYHGSGIYGHVKLIVLPRVYITPNGGVFITTKVEKNSALLTIDTNIKNDSSVTTRLTVTQDLMDRSGRVVGHIVTTDIIAASNKSSNIKQDIFLKSPKLWSPDSPYLYTLKTSLYKGGSIIDTVQTMVGIRTIRFDAKTGFWLNHKNIKLKGVCEHEEMMPVGLAVPDKMTEWRIRTLKTMGCNAIRTAHNPCTPVFYDTCDRLGMMVIDEIFDGWHRKGANDYGGRFFKQWWKRDVRDWVRRDRNHPCVIMYSIGNETGVRDKNHISGEIKKYDTSRPTTGGTVFYGVDVAGFNGPAGVPGFLEKFHNTHPDIPVVLTELPHTVQTRGFYRAKTWWRNKNNRNARYNYPSYSPRQIFFGGNIHYASSYDNACVRINARMCWKRTRDTPWISGEFRWTGFECFGEAQFLGVIFPKRTYNAGVIDLAGLPKDDYYFYQSQWTKKPMVHLLPHWTWPLLKYGTQIPVVAYSNCQEVELFCNGKTLGRKKQSSLLDFVWQVPWHSGELKAIAYRNNKPVAEDIVHTAGRPVKIKLDVSNSQMAADHSDISRVTVSARDARGVLVPWSNNRVDFHIDGPVKFLGLENGDPMDGTANRKLWRRLFYGLARGFFQSTDQPGPIEITAVALLGDTLFQDKTNVAVDIERVSLRGKLKKTTFEIHYTTDGSKPDKSSPVYVGGFTLTQTTVVKVLVLRNGVAYLRTETLFKKGPEPHLVLK